MKFKDKYTPKSESEPGKKVLSDDTFAIGEMMDEIVTQLFRSMK